MEKVHVLLRILLNAERNVASDLLAIGERHKTDHEIYHVTRDLAEWSQTHQDLIVEAAHQAGADLNRPGIGSRPLRVVREKTSELLGRRPETGLLVLRDLRKLHLDLVGLSVDWELLGQTAQGLKNHELLALSQRCHPDTLRQVRWTNSMIKVMSPQIMTT